MRKTLECLRSVRRIQLRCDLVGFLGDSRGFSVTLPTKKLQNILFALPNFQLTTTCNYRTCNTHVLSIFTALFGLYVFSAQVFRNELPTYFRSLYSAIRTVRFSRARDFASAGVGKREIHGTVLRAGTLASTPTPVCGAADDGARFLALRSMGGFQEGGRCAGFYNPSLLLPTREVAPRTANISPGYLLKRPLGEIPHNYNQSIIF